MELLDRGLQRRLLNDLAYAYPDGRGPYDLGYRPGQAEWEVNMHYLAEHGLVQISHPRSHDEPSNEVVLARATAKGLDFLQDDGGLSAMLGVVTVRFDTDTLRALIEARINASDAPTKQKSAVKKKVAELGSEALKELTKKLVGKGLENWEVAFEVIKQMAS